jgi:hypothetical protein
MTDPCNSTTTNADDGTCCLYQDGERSDKPCYAPKGHPFVCGRVVKERINESRSAKPPSTPPTIEVKRP